MEHQSRQGTDAGEGGGGRLSSPRAAAALDSSPPRPTLKDGSSLTDGQRRPLNTPMDGEETWQQEEEEGKAGTRVGDRALGTE